MISGCSSSSPARPEPRSKIDPSQVEYLDREAVVKEEVASQPTRFSVPNKQVNELWKRAGLLGKTYLNTDTEPKVLKSYSPKGFHLRHFPKVAADGSRKGFAYEIQVGRSQAPQKSNVSVFVVNMRTGQQDQKSMMLAKNISRFLQTGVLERDLLSQ